MSSASGNGRGLFVGGTASNSGKTWMVTAICAWLRRRGVRVAPFKAQNMSNHSFPCVGGGEIGRAQVVQAEACGLDPEPSMNPILLKPNGNGTSQVVVRGRVWKTLTARDYYAEFPTLLPVVLDAYQDLARRFDVVVIEGAGSVSEVNLRSVDLVNLGLVTRIDVPWVLVADVDRGGVFASIVGTLELATPEERARFRGFLVNRFRGDRSLFDDGRALLEARTGSPCRGVFPYAEHIDVDAEDSLALPAGPRTSPPAGARVAIIRFPRLSNGTDFRLLTWADWLAGPVDTLYDFVILPGTKDTIGDLHWLQARGLDKWVRRQHAGGATIIGLCGGFQMLGDTIDDPHGLESTVGEVEGLKLLSVRTVLAPEKVTRVVRAALPTGESCRAYEIHLGVTTLGQPYAPFAMLDDGTSDGARGDRVMGTYLHGVLEDAGVLSSLLGVPVAAPATRADHYGALADWFEKNAIAPESWIL